MPYKSFPTREDIERRAFQIYMARGREQGKALEHWLIAEAELIEACNRALARRTKKWEAPYRLAA
jgi:Protein of unknown function (DUF2934)